MLESNTANLVKTFDEQVAQRPDAPVLIEVLAQGSSVSYSYAQLAQWSQGWAEHLSAAGIAPGGRVMITVPMSANLYALLIALWRIGATAIFPDTSMPREGLAKACDILAPQAFVGIPKAHLLRCFVPSIRRIPLHFVVNGWLPFTQSLPQPAKYFAQPPSALDMIFVSDDSPALITFTSGSTGEPKIACRSHRFLLTQRSVAQRTLKIQPSDVDLTTLPIFILVNFAAGATTVMPPGILHRPGHIEPGPVLQAIHDHGVNRATGSPAFFRRLLQDPAAKELQLEHIFTGGAPVLVDDLNDFAAMTSTGHVVAVYGSTEAEPIAELSAAQLDDSIRQGAISGQGLCVGRPVENIRVNILRYPTLAQPKPLSESAFTAACCRPGQVGEIIVQGIHVLSGYMHGVGDAENKIWVDGRCWHRTGDAGYVDALGRLWLLGRCAAAVRMHGRWVFPFEIELAALQCEAVGQAAWLSVDDQAQLVVSPKKPKQSIDVIALAAALPIELAPQDIVQVASIPLDKRHNAKVDYVTLRQYLRIRQN